MNGMGESFLSVQEISKRPKRLKYNAGRRRVRDKLKKMCKTLQDIVRA